MPRGGVRPGAGRKPQPRPPSPLDGIVDPLQFLLAAMRDPTQTAARRVRAAIAATPYLHRKADAPAVKPEPAPTATVSKFKAAPLPIKPQPRH